MASGYFQSFIYITNKRVVLYISVIYANAWPNSCITLYTDSQYNLHGHMAWLNSALHGRAEFDPSWAYFFDPKW